METFGWWYDAISGGILGAITASFLCVCSERLPRGESIGGRSLCACGRQLRWSENLPILGWLKSGGKARCCGSSIPVRYLYAETFLLLVWGAAGAFVRADLLVGVGIGVLGVLAVLFATWQRTSKPEEGA